uniref:CTLH domain-containing protein n=2 Tax=Mesocestoides corti TaxID=53468 RepID=A0A5K3FRV0_MESCO
MARPAVDAPAQTSAIPATSCPSSPSTTSVPVDEDEAPSKDPPNSKLSPTLLHSNGLKYSISPRLKRWAKMWSLKDLFKSTSSSSSWSTPLRHRKATHDSTTDETDDAEAAKSSVASTDVESPSQQVWECGGGDRWPESPAEANQRIRLAELIRQGHYLQAISQLTKNYPSLIQAMPSIVFMLRCRYFIEMLFANQHPPTEANGDFTHKASPAKATSAPPNPDCRKAAKGTRTFKRTQPSSSPECSPCGGGGNCLRQSAALRRKCEVTNGSLNGGGSGNLVEGDDDDDEEGGLFKENLPVACAYQENGSIAVVQATRCVQNGVSTLTKEKTRAAAARSLFKCSSLTSVENTLEPPVQSGVVQQNAHVPSTVAMETRSTNDSPTPASDSSPLQQSPLDLNSVVQLGRELRDNARELQANNAISPTQLALLQDAFSLFAYENPYESPFSDLMHPKHRKMLAESVNNAILVKLGKARCSLLEIGIGLLEEAMLDDRVDGRLAVDTGDTKVHWKQHNQTSTSSAGSTPTPSHAASAAAAYPAAAAAAATLQSTVRIFAPSSSPRSNASSQYNRGHRRHHHSHHHHHRSTTTTTSALVVTSTSTSQTPAQAFPPGTPHSALIYQRSPSLSTSPAGRRLRNTIVQSSPHDEDGVVDHLQEASTSGGVDWGEEVAGDEVALNWDEALCVPPARSGLEMAGFFHPVFFVPRSKP